MDRPVGTKYSRLLDHLRECEGIVIAFSGGVDSLLLLHASVNAVGADQVEAVIGVSPTLPEEELRLARDFCETLEVTLHEIETGVMKFKQFTSNSPERCYHCRVRLSHVLESFGSGVKSVVDGANADDLLDYRPGIQAADEHGVIHPLIMAGFRKKEIRDALRSLGYPEDVYDRPASPCLSSRIPYEEEITHEKLERVGRAERYLRKIGFRELRVRHYTMSGKPAAVVEISETELGTFDRMGRGDIVERLKDMGFARVFLDLEGFRSGKMNDFIDHQGEKERSVP